MDEQDMETTDYQNTVPPNASGRIAASLDNLSQTSPLLLMDDGLDAAPYVHMDQRELDQRRGNNSSSFQQSSWADAAVPFQQQQGLYSSVVQPMPSRPTGPYIPLQSYSGPWPQEQNMDIFGDPQGSTNVFFQQTDNIMAQDSRPHESRLRTQQRTYESSHGHQQNCGHIPNCLYHRMDVAASSQPGPSFQARGQSPEKTAPMVHQFHEQTSTDGHTPTTKPASKPAQSVTQVGLNFFQYNPAKAIAKANSKANSKPNSKRSLQKSGKGSTQTPEKALDFDQQRWSESYFVAVALGLGLLHPPTVDDFDADPIWVTAFQTTMNATLLIYPDTQDADQNLFKRLFINNMVVECKAAMRLCYDLVCRQYWFDCMKKEDIQDAPIMAKLRNMAHCHEDLVNVEGYRSHFDAWVTRDFLIALKFGTVRSPAVVHPAAFPKGFRRRMLAVGNVSALRIFEGWRTGEFVEFDDNKFFGLMLPRYIDELERASKDEHTSNELDKMLEFWWLRGQQLSREPEQPRDYTLHLPSLL
ncbi:hypothetical protein GALMADRAFT_217633 [Galerina marginata CBS 339.88]|uniref:Uncharacterized protein n=1 Tax=Galerina marginata (strain CBS 339.88) TaxID=685588 RepID=A0A067SEM7_GALM3|nr:hypothetical protein GALMADRAFT_217633 [Galerina marginata CBS 339.88]